MIFMKAFLISENMENIEVWKDVVGYEGHYQVGSLGNIKSLKYNREAILIPSITKTGYFTVSLFKSGKTKTKRIHQLVAESFLGHTRCGYLLVVNHKNHIRTDNRVNNLEIVTQRQNTDRKHLKSTSKFVGVSFSSLCKKWRSMIVLNGNAIHLGLFDTEEEASKFYQNAVISISKNETIEVKKPKYSSKYKGVCWSKRYNKWNSYIYIKRKQIRIGLFDTELQAHNANKHHY